MEGRVRGRDKRRRRGRKGLECWAKKSPSLPFPSVLSLSFSPLPFLSLLFAFLPFLPPSILSFPFILLSPSSFSFISFQWSFSPIHFYILWYRVLRVILLSCIYSLPLINQCFLSGCTLSNLFFESWKITLLNSDAFLPTVPLSHSFKIIPSKFVVYTHHFHFSLKLNEI